MKRWVARVALVLSVLSAGTAFAVQPAVADSTSEFPSCWDGEVGTGPNFHWPTGSGGNASGYSYSPLFTVPGSPYTGCEDINVSCGVTQCGDYRIRFYPSSGGNYANSWKSPPCGQSWCYVAAATDVVNGTNYRVEWRLYAGGPWGDQRFEMWV